MMRVAVAQFATSLNVQENLATCIRMITEAASCQPKIIVLPEYCNTQPYYENHNQAWQQALTLNGDFLAQISAQAKLHKCYIVLNVSLRRDLSRNDETPLIRSNISVTTCIFSASGELIGQADKESLLTHEKEFFINPNKAIKTITSPLGKFGCLTGAEVTRYNKTRELALQGAQLICNSQSYQEFNQTPLYDLARACENNVFIATANKLCSFTNQQKVGSNKLPSIPRHSQIVTLHGKVLATLASDKEGFIFADIEIEKAGLEKYQRPDGTNFIEQYRPELYPQMALTIKNQTSTQAVMLNNKLPDTANVVLFATYKSNEQAIEDVCYYIENNLSDIIQLPELFFISDKSILNNTKHRLEIETLCSALITQISAVLRSFQYVCTSLVINGAHQAVLINENGLFATQQQLHFCNRYSWSSLGANLNIIELTLEQGVINIAMLTADDANMPELVDIAVLGNINALLLPIDIQASCEVDVNLLSRAAEHNVCIVASSREKSFANMPCIEDISKAKSGNIKKIKPQKSTGLVIDIINTHTPLTKLKVKPQHGKITKALIHPNDTFKYIFK